MTASERTWQLASAEQTRTAGWALGEALRRFVVNQPLLIALRGELGAGKTTLVGGLMAALGHVGAVRSPTYTLIEPYELLGCDLYHLDLYRLTEPNQLEELGVRDLLKPGAVLLVEWPERGGAVLRAPDLTISLAYPARGSDGRQLTLQVASEHGEQLIDSTDFSAIYR